MVEHDALVNVDEINVLQISLLHACRVVQRECTVLNMANSNDVSGSYKWESLKPMPTKRVFSTPVEAANGHLFVIGGCDQMGTPIDAFEVNARIYFMHVKCHFSRTTSGILLGSSSTIIIYRKVSDRTVHPI